MSTQPAKNGSKSSPRPPMHRWVLALVVTSSALVGILLISLAVILAAGNEKKEATQMVLSMVLPVLASWVGTVLAYYFSSESVEAATRSVKELISPEEKLKSVNVSDVMIPKNSIVYFTYSDALTVKEIRDKLISEDKGWRAPIFSEKNNPLYMLHRSAISEAVLKLKDNGQYPDPATGELTLKALFEKERPLAGKEKPLEDLATGSFAVIGKNSTLADAQAAMRSIEDCQDVFVTDTGGKDGAVIGWVTNHIIEQNAKA